MSETWQSSTKSEESVVPHVLSIHSKLEKSEESVVPHVLSIHSKLEKSEESVVPHVLSIHSKLEKMKCIADELAQLQQKLSVV